MTTTQELQALARLYVQIHANKNDSAADLLMLYHKALEELMQADKAQNKPVERRSLLGCD